MKEEILLLELQHLDTVSRQEGKKLLQNGQFLRFLHESRKELVVRLYCLVSSYLK